MKKKFFVRKYVMLEDDTKIIEHDGKEIKLYRIKALSDYNFSQNKRFVDFTDVEAFEDKEEALLGGYIAKEENLSQEGGCWVHSGAMVFGNAKIYDNANIAGQAVICDNVVICNETIIADETHVSGNARIYGKTYICGKSIIGENAKITGMVNLEDITVLGDTKIICSMPEPDKKKGKKPVVEQPKAKEEIAYVFGKDVVVEDAMKKFGKTPEVALEMED